MAERAALTLAEELEMLGPVRASNNEEAQTNNNHNNRQHEETGQIVVGRGDEDAFVA